MSFSRPRLLRSTRIVRSAVSNSVQHCEERQISVKGDSSNLDEPNNGDIVLPPEPQDCCMSGCSNCVWIKYAQDIADMLGKEGGDIAKAKIQKHVKDPNLRAFLMLELRDLFKDKN